jgi:hypothetical protein
MIQGYYFRPVVVCGWMSSVSDGCAFNNKLDFCLILCDAPEALSRLVSPIFAPSLKRIGGGGTCGPPIGANLPSPIILGT